MKYQKHNIKDELEELETKPIHDIYCWMQLVQIAMSRINELNNKHKVLSKKSESYINYMCDRIILEALSQLDPAVIREKINSRAVWHKEWLRRRKDAKHLSRSLAKILK